MDGKFGRYLAKPHEKTVQSRIGVPVNATEVISLGVAFEIGELWGCAPTTGAMLPGEPLGASAAGLDPVLAVVGDLSFHHDLNGLVAARARGVSATIVIVNNDGGGIFSFLSIARHGDAFERLVATPHGLRFEHAAALYGIPYETPASTDELAAAARDSLERRETRILEITSDRDRNRADHEAFWSSVIAAVDERGG